MFSQDAFDICPRKAWTRASLSTIRSRFWCPYLISGQREKLKYFLLPVVVFFLFSFVFCAAVLPRDFQPGVSVNLCQHVSLLYQFLTVIIYSVMSHYTSWFFDHSINHKVVCWFTQLLTCRCTCSEP